ncbi:hypothetical protein E3P77_01953 [Wallemia ichthyophaga]|uniref:Survival motor neuron-like protein 1 n=1 Tax=Wallemia ichthyophaga (strain EXF-994 / CBS 113033) TaxID=1299270 RepID=R9AAQ9_WALI9|nr:uncharacterized protein J056_001854 [Wallemia ichthyophaga EXF-994]TIA82550.1 hypothetical protein E3P98_01253 [Wallemia ichthyophaga]EOQ99298.1 hypothetical protein J056_001854 [Wallemia ichthyophaga EXF-994]TIB36104.1 hypothetical protein E3P84_01042 [Wallemia ichthyophaga]TIB41567.1 hypothetical protein E3P83_01908 [Wallemia ichthyophaga]TIB66891.1 hypothetical protein E3P77_01953 [Wallemia ichthyophaga]
MSDSSRQPISYSDVAPEEIPETALPDPNFVAELRDSKPSHKQKRKSKKQRNDKKKIDQMSQYFDEIDAGVAADGHDDEEDSEEFAEAAFIDGDLSVWDDSMLLEAWDAANEEYRLLHGDQSWKTDPNHQLETPSMIWYDSSTDLGKIAAKQSAEKVAATTNKQSKRKRDSSEEMEESEASADIGVEAERPSKTSRMNLTNTAAPSQVNNTVNTGDPGKDYILHQLSQAWYAAGYWTGILHEKYGEAGQ